MLKKRQGGMAANLMFLLTALIWGFAFVAQRQGADYLAPFSFNSAKRRANVLFRGHRSSRKRWLWQ